MSILHALNGLYDRLESNRKAPPYGFSRENISYAIVLSPDGSVSELLDLRDTSAKPPRPRRLEVPRAVKRSGQPVPNFLWDKTSFTLGVEPEKRNKDASQTPREHTAFKDFHEELLESSSDAGAQAFLRFLREWKVEEYERLCHAGEMRGTNIVFSLEDVTQLIHERDAIRQIWLNHVKTEEGPEGLCLVSGERMPIARLHASVKGVAGAKGSGASIVSFDKHAFRSFGKERGANAPVSERAAFAYTTSLNTLLEGSSRQRIQVGDTTTVFWADASGNEAKASVAEGLFSMLTDPPTDEQEAARVRDKLSRVAQGRPLREIEPELDGEDTRFFVLGLAPNAARLSIRFWHEDSIAAVTRCIGEHWRDLRLEPAPWRSPPAARHLLYETAVQRKAQNIQPTLGGTLMNAILTGQPYPRSLMAAVVMRIRADKAPHGMTDARRAAILKACLVRNLRIREQTPQEDHLVSLDEHSNSIAYNLGRLFAAYAYAEKSLAPRNATIRDKYMGAASATPRRVFPVLMRGYEHNRAGLAKGDARKRGSGVQADRTVGKIIGLLPGEDELPASLPLEDQARFFIGYYHQEADFYTRSETPADNDESALPEE